MSENHSSESPTEFDAGQSLCTFEATTFDALPADTEPLVGNVGDVPIAHEAINYPDASLLASLETESVLCHAVSESQECGDSLAQYNGENNAEAATTAPQDIVADAHAESAFGALGLYPKVVQSIELAGYEKPTAIQAKIIPLMIAGRDVIAQSQTGSGKTAAFALPILNDIRKKSKLPQALVLTPTRELAIQVAKSFTTYSSSQKKFQVAAIYGGQDYQAQFTQLRRGVQVVVGTPGRVIDHISRGTLDLSGIRCLVLDEADEMLNMGFLEDVEHVLQKTPSERQTALFSATMPEPIRKIASRHLNDPAKVMLKKKTMTAESISQRALILQERDKLDALTRLLEVETTDGVIVFTKTKESTVSVAEKLQRYGLAAASLNGDMPQKNRERTIERLKAGELDVLVATDVAARGLDVPRISHVFNYDLPHDSESYVHRIGRTGRAGRKGEAIILLTPRQQGKLRLIERATRQSIQVVDAPTADQVNEMRIKRFKERITEMAANEDLTFFKELIQNYSEESGKPTDMIAAALAQIAQGGRPFLLKDMPRSRRRGRDEDRREQRPKRGRERSFSDERFDEESRPRRGRHQRQIGPPSDGMTRYRIGVGRRDGVRPGNIVGAIANEAGLAGEDIGPIQINDSYSTVDLPEGMPSEVYQTLQHTWVAGKQLRIQQSDGSADSESDFRERKPFSRGKGKGKPGTSFKSRSTSARRPKSDGGKGSGRGKPKKRKSRSK